ncbi:hypothetical protein RD792_012609 [Penstemon davidsonii]|uniref:Protein N-terminal glutamine amidohydrolase n=1 Tax=Penstemon davidsonii TaxID=160366 RepID=A0ABR0CYV5_9LAMI|nr:hypothetical protein RD792_012609 [Penstemon davidsonii]
MATLNSNASSSSSSSLSPTLEASRFLHTPHYCEENVYMLCKNLSEDGIAKSDSSDLFVVFISNEKKQASSFRFISIWGFLADGVILWDYHVICVQNFKYGKGLFRDFRVFRIVHAPIFLRNFASDRRHMKDSDGNWNSPPPSYDVIVAQDGTVHNLNEYMEMSSADVVKTIGADTVETVLAQKLGVLVSETQLEELFSLIS